MTEVVTNQSASFEEFGQNNIHHLRIVVKSSLKIVLASSGQFKEAIMKNGIIFELIHKRIQ